MSFKFSSESSIPARSKFSHLLVASTLFMSIFSEYCVGNIQNIHVFWNNL